MPVKPTLVKVVEVGYLLDNTAHGSPIVRMILGYGLLIIFIILGFKSTLVCLYVIIGLLVLFTLEPIPYQISCVLPLFLFPVLQLLKAKELSGAYMNDDILRAIASMLVGLIAMKSPVSRRASLWLLRLTGVRVWRVLLSVMVIAFIVSMFIDPTMATGILAGFMDALVLEVYANNLRIRYAYYLLSVVKPTEAAPAEVDFVIKDSLNDRRRHSYADSTRAGLQDCLSMDSKGKLKEKIFVVDREKEEASVVKPPVTRETKKIEDDSYSYDERNLSSDDTIVRAKSDISATSIKSAMSRHKGRKHSKAGSAQESPTLDSFRNGMTIEGPSTTAKAKDKTEVKPNMMFGPKTRETATADYNSKASTNAGMEQSVIGRMSRRSKLLSEELQLRNNTEGKVVRASATDSSVYFSLDVHGAPSVPTTVGTSGGQREAAGLSRSHKERATWLYSVCSWPYKTDLRSKDKFNGFTAGIEGLTIKSDYGLSQKGSSEHDNHLFIDRDSPSRFYSESYETRKEAATKPKLHICYPISQTKWEHAPQKRNLLGAKRALQRRKLLSAQKVCKKLGSNHTQKSKSRTKLRATRGYKKALTTSGVNTESEGEERTRWNASLQSGPMDNPFLATDVSFRLNSAAKKPKVFWKLRQWTGGRGDALSNHRSQKYFQAFRASQEHHYHSSRIHTEPDKEEELENDSWETYQLQAVILQEKEKAKSLRTALLLALAYASNFGSMVTFGGAQDYLRSYLTKNLVKFKLDMSAWWFMHFPFGIISLLLSALVLYVLLIRKYDNNETGVYPPSRVVIRDRLHIMGSMSYGEYVSIFLVIAAIVLLAFRDPFFMSEGWSQWLSVEQEVMAASVGLMVGLMAFLFPTDILPGDHKKEIIAWGDLHKRLPWGVIFLIGGSSTISAAMEKNGVYDLIEEKLLNLTLKPSYLQYFVVIIIACVGELSMYKSRIAHFLRTGAKLADKFGKHPLFFLLPINIMCHLSLILPSASAGSAVAFELAAMTSLQMIVPGFIIKTILALVYISLVRSSAFSALQPAHPYIPENASWAIVALTHSSDGQPDE